MRAKSEFLKWFSVALATGSFAASMAARAGEDMNKLVTDFKDLNRAPASTEPEDQAAKERDVRELLKVQRSERVAFQTINQVLQLMGPRLSEENRKKLSASVGELAQINDIFEIFVPIYARRFTHREIREMLRFYNSPLGQKMMETHPLVMQDAGPEIQKWAQAFVKRVEAKFNFKGAQPNRAVSSHPKK